MPDRRTTFRENVARIETDATNASDDLIRRLKKLTPEEFLRQPPRVFNQLKLDQYRDVVATIAPRVRLPASDTNEVSGNKTRGFALKTWWRERSALARSMIVTIIVSIIFSATGMIVPLAVKWTLSRTEIVRPTMTANWPVCKRLSEYTDGCVYYPTQDLNWDWVAQKLNIPLEILRRTNRHLPWQWIPANTQLVVWRERGRLED
jgi:hypothetical protein